MKNTPEKDYTHTGWISLTALIAVLAAVSFIPPQSFGGLKLRRANILSELIDFDDGTVAEQAPVLFDEEEFRVDMEQVAEQIVADTVRPAVQTLFAWSIPRDSVAVRRIVPDTVRFNEVLVPIEDFSPDSCMRAFCDTLLAGRRPVRIAFMGDSFVEGDILTADLRERLQTAYGGGGAGFAPMASPLTGFRRTIRTQSKGWASYNIMQRRAAPASLREHFYVSGWVCQPSAGASTRWESTDARERLDSCTAARILFISPRDSRIEVTLNDTLRQEFAVAGDASVRQIAVTAPRIRSLALRVVSGHEGFIGYGAVFESDGIVVDNYSVRSNNGQAMFWTNPSVNAQIDAMLRYDLVILQYGLNIMQSGVRAYGHYAAQIGKMVAFVRECFPGAAVLVMGVSDRSVKTEAGFEPMDAVPHMLAAQRRAAAEAGAAFWPTSEAMRSMGGMEGFVRRGWAGKDYTHINYAGGRRVAWSLFDALNARVREAFARRRPVAPREEALIDSLRRAGIRDELCPAAVPPASGLPAARPQQRVHTSKTPQR